MSSEREPQGRAAAIGRGRIAHLSKLPLLQVLGPGLISGAADDDPTAIATYSQAGARFGYGLCWLMPLVYPLMAIVQQVSARVGRTTRPRPCRQHPPPLPQLVRLHHLRAAPDR